jgi:hypothetical protein
LPQTLLSTCHSVSFGYCLCGRAASTRQVQYAECIDERHENRYSTIVPHGHYNILIIAAEKVLGVIVIYLEEGIEMFTKHCSEIATVILIWGCQNSAAMKWCGISKQLMPVQR